MTRSTLANEGLPTRVLKSLKQLGLNLRLARQRRNMTQATLAQNMFVTAKTVRRMESGDPGVSMGVYATALFVMGMENVLSKIASPEADSYANWQVRESAPQRIRNPKNRPNLNF